MHVNKKFFFAYFAEKDEVSSGGKYNPETTKEIACSCGCGSSLMGSSLFGGIFVAPSGGGCKRNTAQHQVFTAIGLLISHIDSVQLFQPHCIQCVYEGADGTAEPETTTCVNKWVHVDTDDETKFFHIKRQIDSVCNDECCRVENAVVVVVPASHSYWTTVEINGDVRAYADQFEAQVFVLHAGNVLRRFSSSDIAFRGRLIELSKLSMDSSCDERHERHSVCIQCLDKIEKTSPFQKLSDIEVESDDGYDDRSVLHVGCAASRVMGNT